MIDSLYAGASGVKTYNSAMTVTGSNIANVNTAGFKSNRVAFKDLLATSLSGSSNKIGKGVSISSVDAIHTQGTFESSELETDLGIDGEGFFMVANSRGEKFYTRAGQFQYDKDGFLVTNQGLPLLMSNVDENTKVSVGAPQKINLLKTQDPPKKTGDGILSGSGLTISANINIDSKIPEIPFNANNVKTSMYNFSTTTTAYDAVGNEHTVTLAFRKMPDQEAKIDAATGQKIPGTEARNMWKWFAVVPGEDLEGGKAGVMQAAGGGFLKFGNDGRLLEDIQGKLVTQAPGQPGQPGQPGEALKLPELIQSQKDPDNKKATINFNFKGTGTEQKIGFNFGKGSNPGDPTDKRDGLDGMTQFASDNKVIFIGGDGHKSGALQNIKIHKDGLIEGAFDSGNVRAIGRVVLAKFASNEGLQRKGDNLFQESLKSGKAIVNDPGLGGSGEIRSKTLEKSNVDLATEFVKMIEHQRAFQSSAKTVTTADEMISDLLQMKR